MTTAIQASADAGTRLPPHVPAAPHHNQRYFNRDDSTRRSSSIRPPRSAVGQGEIKVWRYAEDDKANLCIEVRVGQLSSEICVDLTAQELRNLADRLLDAAHDLESNPASSLAGGAA